MCLPDAFRGGGFTGLVRFQEVFGLMFELLDVRPGRQFTFHNELSFTPDVRKPGKERSFNCYLFGVDSVLPADR
jgi:hypothetical protein